ncbi:MAG: beta-ketoacyl synthase N-terminal-like domain-containing protein, partial [Pseudomonadota bacterium]|nr:beta-ketoacyl synthase N-terminal-like domain-containing protein [Pseudomonadota bacterium]
MGAVTPLGVGVDHVWRRLLNGESGISTIQSYEPNDLACQIAGHVPVGETADGAFKIDDWVDRKDQRKMDPFIA